MRSRGIDRQQPRSCVRDRGQYLPTQTRAEAEPFHTQTWSEDRRYRLFSDLPLAPRPGAPDRTWCFQYEAARQARQAKLAHKAISQNHRRAGNACLPVAAHHKRQLASDQSSAEFLHVQNSELETWLYLFLPSSEVCAARASAARAVMEVLQASQADTPDGQALHCQSEPLTVPKPDQFEAASHEAKVTPTATASKEWQRQKAPAPARKAVRRTMLKLRASTATEVCTQHAAVPSLRSLTVRSCAGCSK